MRQDDPEPRAIRLLVDRVFPRAIRATVERVDLGVSTHVYRIHRGSERFYLRVLPEIGESFAPEVRVHATLRRLGVGVPEVVYFEHRNDPIGKSVLVTTEIAGRSLAQTGLDRDVQPVLFAAGRDLALINTVPVDGFGWINRDRSWTLDLDAEHPSNRAFVAAELAVHLPILRARGGPARVRSTRQHHPAA